MVTAKKVSVIRVIGAIAVALAAAVLGSTASAATLKLTTTFDVSRGAVAPDAFPTDPNGLDGSTFVVDTIFADGTTFQRSFAEAQSTTVTISGASVASSNGTFTVTDRVGLFQSSDRGGLGKIADLGFFVFQDGFAVPGIIKSIKFDARGTVGRSPTAAR